MCSGCHSEFGERYIERVETSKENYDETSCLQTKVYVIRIPCKVYGFKDRSLLSLLNYTLYGIRMTYCNTRFSYFLGRFYTRSIALTKFGMTARAHEGRDTKREPNAQRPTTTSRSWHNAGRWVRTTTPANAKNRWLPWNQFIVILILSIVVDSPTTAGPLPLPIRPQRRRPPHSSTRCTPRHTRSARSAARRARGAEASRIVGVVPFDRPPPCGYLRPEGGPEGARGGRAVHPDADAHGGRGRRWAGQERAVTEEPV